MSLPEKKYPDISEHQRTNRVITSIEFREKLIEKERKKKEVAERKAFNKAERERKKQERETKMKKNEQTSLHSKL